MTTFNQRYKKNFRPGWFKESYRHMLASKGISTKTFKPLRSSVDITAACRFGGRNIKNLPRVGSGRDREVFELPEQDVVVKIAKNPGGLQQNVYEGDYIAPVPDIFERGKDFVVVKKADPPGEVTKSLLKDLKRFTQKDFDDKTGELQDVLNRHGIGDLLNYNISLGDLQRRSSWGEIDGEPVIVDAGLLSADSLRDYRIKDFNDLIVGDSPNKEFYRDQLRDWEDIKRERRLYKVRKS